MLPAVRPPLGGDEPAGGGVSLGKGGGVGHEDQAPGGRVRKAGRQVVVVFFRKKHSKFLIYTDSPPLLIFPFIIIYNSYS